MKIQSVIFDLDGTLLDTIADIADATNEMLREHGYPEHGLENYIQWVGNGARKLVVSCLPENADLSDAGLDRFMEAYYKSYERNIDNKTQMYEGIDTVLDDLVEKGISFSINTNKPHEHTLILREKYFKPWDFKYIYGQRGTFPKKPDPGAALAISTALGVKPENTLFVGDSAVDIKTAQNAGMLPLGVRWGYGNQNWMEELGAKMIDTPSQIIDFIKTLE